MFLNGNVNAASYVNDVLRPHAAPFLREEWNPST